jgi:purine-binding chemotaxis protein CheW
MIPDLQAVENRVDPSLQNLLVFRLGTQAFALSIEVVVQIIPMLKLTPLPQSDAVIEGVANIRGTITPVMSVRRRLGMDPIPARLHTPIILIRLGNYLIGLVVDEVIDILSLPATQVARPDQIMPEGLEISKVLEGIIFIDSQNILLLNPYTLVMPGSMRANMHTYKEILEKAAIPEVDPPSTMNLQVPQPVEEPLPARPAVVPTQVVESQPEPVLAEETPAPAPSEPAPETAPRTTGKKRGHSRAARTEKVLADQIAILAIDLPPANGEDPQSPEASQDTEETA